MFIMWHHITEVIAYLSGGEVHEDIENLDALFDSGDGIEGWRYDVLHHHL